MSKKKRSFINFISIISMLGLSIGCAALIIILSFFNGLEELNRQVFKAFDPALKITKKKEKFFQTDTVLLQKIRAIEGVRAVSEVIEDKALAKSDYAQMIVVLRGMDANFVNQQELKNATQGGEFSIEDEEGPKAFIGNGVAGVLKLDVNDMLNPLQLLYPRNAKLNILNPEQNIMKTALPVSGVFMLEEQYDNYVYLPLQTMEYLTDKQNQRSSYDLQLHSGVDTDKVKKTIQTISGTLYDVKNRDEQNEVLFKAIKVEKLFIFIGLFCIVALASITIFFGVSMLVLDKKDDIFILQSLGASATTIRRIFISEGVIIGLIAVLVGNVIGLGVCFAQMKFGFLKLGIEYSLVDAYPVHIRIWDVCISSVGILFLCIFATLYPARKAIS
ncbi:MAG: ABC transporter permease [Leadbetterella sp.]